MALEGEGSLSWDVGLIGLPNKALELDSHIS